MYTSSAQPRAVQPPGGVEKPRHDPPKRDKQKPAFLQAILTRGRLVTPGTLAGQIFRRNAQSFVETLRLARVGAETSDVGFHDCRHFFISYCVMSGIDYMTIARWVGHQDGGVLSGKVYGHLSDEHAKRQAEKLNFGAAK